MVIMMKKILFLFLILFLMTGCSKKLTCVKSDKQDGIKTNETFITTYRDDTVSSIQIDLESTLSKKYESYAETIEKNLKKQFEKYQNMKGASVISSHQDEVIHVQLFIELDKMSAKNKKKLNFLNLKDNYDDVKKTLEKKKYQCN